MFTVNSNKYLFRLYYLIILLLVIIDTASSFKIQIYALINIEDIFKFTDTNRTFLSDWNLYIQAANWNISGANVYSSEFAAKHSDMGFLYSPLVLNILSYFILAIGVDLFRTIGVLLFLFLYPAIIALLYINILKKIRLLNHKHSIAVSIILIFSTSLFWFNSISTGNISGLLLLIIVYYVIVSENKYNLYFADFFILLLSLIKPQFTILIFHRALTAHSPRWRTVTLINLVILIAANIYTVTVYWGQVIEWITFIREATIGNHDDGLLLMRYLNNKLIHRKILGIAVFGFIYIYLIMSYLKLKSDKPQTFSDSNNLAMIVMLGLLVISPRYREYDIFVVYIASALLIVRNWNYTGQLVLLILLFETVRLVKIGTGGNYFYPSASSYFMLYTIYLAIKSSRAPSLPSKMINNKEIDD